MAQLHSLCFLPSRTSISLLEHHSFSPSLSSLSLSSPKPTSLSIRRISRLNPICSSSSTTLTVQNPSSELSPNEQKQESVELSDTRLLAQNIPWLSTADDIRALFQNYGTVVDVQLSMHNKSRNRGLTFVEMGSAEEAANALAKLEGYEFEGRTLRMSYATPKKEKTNPRVQSKPPVVYTLFVANLSFAARAKDLRELFQSGGSEVVSVEVIFHENPRRSSGYGFVSFKTKKEADDALVIFEGKELMGRPIRVARSNRFVKPQSELKPQSEEEEDVPADTVHDYEETETVDNM